MNLLAQKQHKKPIRAPVKQSHFTIAFLLDGSYEMAGKAGMNLSFIPGMGMAIKSLGS